MSGKIFRANADRAVEALQQSISHPPSTEVYGVSILAPNAATVLWPNAITITRDHGFLPDTVEWPGSEQCDRSATYALVAKMGDRSTVYIPCVKWNARRDAWVAIAPSGWANPYLLFRAASADSFPPLKTSICENCKYYYGRSHGGNLLNCAVHPSGLDGSDSCADWEEA